MQHCVVGYSQIQWTELTEDDEKIRNRGSVCGCGSRSSRWTSCRLVPSLIDAEYECGCQIGSCISCSVKLERPNFVGFSRVY
jgi:hypothetical protein